MIRKARKQALHERSLYEQELYEQALRLLPGCLLLEEFRHMVRHYAEHNLPDVDRHHLRDLAVMQDMDAYERESDREGECEENREEE